MNFKCILTNANKMARDSKVAKWRTICTCNKEVICNM